MRRTLRAARSASAATPDGEPLSSRQFALPCRFLAVIYPTCLAIALQCLRHHTHDHMITIGSGAPCLFTQRWHILTFKG